MDILGCLALFTVLVMLAMLAMRAVADTVHPLNAQRPFWPWSITTYNGWNESIHSPPAVRAFFPRPWVS